MTTQIEWLEIHKKVQAAKERGVPVKEPLAALGQRDSAYSSAVYSMRQSGLLPPVGSGKKTLRAKRGKVKAAPGRMVQFAPVEEGRIELQIGDVKLSISRGDKDALRTVMEIAKELNNAGI